MRIARPETHFFIDRHRGSEAVGGFKIDLAMATMPGMIERKFHQLAARAGPASFGEQHDPAQLAALAAIDQCRAAHRFAIDFRKPYAAAPRLVEPGLGNGFDDKVPERRAKAVAFLRIAISVHVDDQLVVARPPIMPESDSCSPHGAGA